MEESMSSAGSGSGQETLAYAAIAAGKLLAKSARRFDTRAESRRLRSLARYPEGARHETLSVALALAEKDRLATAHERDLVLHLIAAHHAWARPFLPAVQEADADREEVDVRPLGCSFFGVAEYDAGNVGSECPERFWSLSRRYGWWGLAWLETLFRLSDYEESAAEEEKEKQLS
jgi:CRISPR-associated endonuclease/helicase Cas3